MVRLEGSLAPRAFCSNRGRKRSRISILKGKVSNCPPHTIPMLIEDRVQRRGQQLAERARVVCELDDIDNLSFSLRLPSFIKTVLPPTRIHHYLWGRCDRERPEGSAYQGQSHQDRSGDENHIQDLRSRGHTRHSAVLSIISPTAADNANNQVTALSLPTCPCRQHQAAILTSSFIASPHQQTRGCLRGTPLGWGNAQSARHCSPQDAIVCPI